MPGVGRIFVKFSNAEDATKALKALAGRKFADRTVVSTYFPEVSSSAASVLFPPSANNLMQANFEVGAW